LSSNERKGEAGSGLGCLDAPRCGCAAVSREPTEFEGTLFTLFLDRNAKDWHAFPDTPFSWKRPIQFEYNDFYVSSVGKMFQIEALFLKQSNISAARH
jgi:hypothetical protein